MFPRHWWLWVAGGVLVAGAAWGQIAYKWVDTSGVTHYSEQPPASRHTVMALRASAPDALVAPATTAPPPADATTSLDAAKVAFRKQACATAQDNLKVLSGHGVVVATGTVSQPVDFDGARKLSDDQRAAEKVKTQRNIITYCDRG
jgi:hypothetical protein